MPQGVPNTLLSEIKSNLNFSQIWNVETSQHSFRCEKINISEENIRSNQSPSACKFCIIKCHYIILST